MGLSGEQKRELVKKKLRKELEQGIDPEENLPDKEESRIMRKLNIHLQEFRRRNK